MRNIPKLGRFASVKNNQNSKKIRKLRNEWQMTRLPDDNILNEAEKINLKTTKKNNSSHWKTTKRNL